jgi:hypothetical protein
MRLPILTLIFLCFASPAVAASCEESFQKKGDFFNGSAFAGRVQLDGVSVEEAFTKLRPILARESIRTISVDHSLGIMKAENPATAFQRALPIDIYAVPDGSRLDVEMVFTLPSGVGAKKETVKQYICGALNQLLPKDEVTATTPGVSNDATAIALDAPSLAKQVAEAAGNPAKIRVNFVDKTFRISGKVLSIVEGNGSYIVAFESKPAAGSTPPSQGNPMAVVCTMAKNQDAAVAALEVNRPATLVGRFQGVDSQTKTIKLQGCVGS